MDIWDKEKRSQVMSKIRSKNTKPELALRKALFARGLRFRVNDKRLSGKPDIVLPQYKTIIFELLKANHNTTQISKSKIRVVYQVKDTIF